MKCVICGSEEHFAACCLQKGSGKGSSSEGNKEGNPRGFAVFAGGEGDSTEPSAELGGLVFDGNPGCSLDHDERFGRKITL